MAQERIQKQKAKVDEESIEESSQESAKDLDKAKNARCRSKAVIASAEDFLRKL